MSSYCYVDTPFNVFRSMTMQFSQDRCVQLVVLQSSPSVQSQLIRSRLNASQQSGILASHSDLQCVVCYKRRLLVGHNNLLQFYIRNQILVWQSKIQCSVAKPDALLYCTTHQSGIFGRTVLQNCAELPLQIVWQGTCYITVLTQQTVNQVQCFLIKAQSFGIRTAAQSSDTKVGLSPGPVLTRPNLSVTKQAAPGADVTTLASVKLLQW